MIFKVVPIRIHSKLLETNFLFQMTTCNFFLLIRLHYTLLAHYQLSSCVQFPSTCCIQSLCVPSWLCSSVPIYQDSCCAVLPSLLCKFVQLAMVLQGGIQCEMGLQLSKHWTTIKRISQTRRSSAHHQQNDRGEGAMLGVLIPPSLHH